MSEILITIAVVIVALLAIVLIIASTKPDTVRVERSATIKAPPDKIFALINDFHQWAKWSPWERRDPQLKRTFSGAASGQGAIYAWEGNRNVGAGRMEIMEAAAQSKIVIKLDFIKPFEGHNIAEFTLSPEAGGTRVHWLMVGPAIFFSKVMQVFLSFDRMIGRDRVRALLPQAAVVAVRVGRGAEIVEGDEGGERASEERLGWKEGHVDSSKDGGDRGLVRTLGARVSGIVVFTFVEKRRAHPLGGVYRTIEMKGERAAYH